MASISETSMACTLDTYQKLIAEISIMGTGYNPGDAALSIIQIAAKYNAVKTAFDDLEYVFAPHTIDADKREASFTKLSKLPGKARNSAKSLNVGTALDTIVRQLRGTQEQPKDDIPVAQLSYAL